MDIEQKALLRAVVKAFLIAPDYWEIKVHPIWIGDLVMKRYGRSEIEVRYGDMEARASRWSGLHFDGPDQVAEVFVATMETIMLLPHLEAAVDAIFSIPWRLAAVLDPLTKELSVWQFCGITVKYWGPREDENVDLVSVDEKSGLVEEVNIEWLAEKDVCEALIKFRTKFEAVAKGYGILEVL